MNSGRPARTEGKLVERGRKLRRPSRFRIFGVVLWIFFGVVGWLNRLARRCRPSSYGGDRHLPRENTFSVSCFQVVFFISLLLKEIVILTVLQDRIDSRILAGCKPYQPRKKFMSPDVNSGRPTQAGPRYLPHVGRRDRASERFNDWSPTRLQTFSTPVWMSE